MTGLVAGLPVSTTGCGLETKKSPPPPSYFPACHAHPYIEVHAQATDGVQLVALHGGRILDILIEDADEEDGHRREEVEAGVHEGLEQRLRIDRIGSDRIRRWMGGGAHALEVKTQSKLGG